MCRNTPTADITSRSDPVLQTVLRMWSAVCYRSLVMGLSFQPIAAHALCRAMSYDGVWVASAGLCVPCSRLAASCASSVAASRPAISSTRLVHLLDRGAEVHRVQGCLFTCLAGCWVRSQRRSCFGNETPLGAQVHWSYA